MQLKKLHNTLKENLLYSFLVLMLFNIVVVYGNPIFDFLRIPLNQTSTPIHIIFFLGFYLVYAFRLSFKLIGKLNTSQKTKKKYYIASSIVNVGYAFGWVIAIVDSSIVTRHSSELSFRSDLNLFLTFYFLPVLWLSSIYYLNIKNQKK